MNGPIVLTEHQDRWTDASPDDAAFIADRLGGQISVRRELRGSGYVLNPRQFVGVVRLPSGCQLESRPKIPARNLFWMLAAACDLPDPFLDDPADLDRVADVLEAAALRFARLLEERLDRGLYRAYVEEEDNLMTVRGRIVVGEDVGRNFALRHRTYCRFSEYSWDVPENRVLRQVVRLLAGWGFRAATGQRLRALDAALGEIAPGRYAPEDLDRFGYHRLNDDYRPLHRLCRLFLEGASPGDSAGRLTFDGFLLDMNRLFEGFVTQALRHLPPPFSIDAQRTLYLDRERQVKMRPDIVVRDTVTPVLALDCKYKRLGTDDHRSDDVYQVLAYCTALGVRRGLLVYPRHLVSIDQAVTISEAGITVGEVSVDLAGSRQYTDGELDRLRRLVLATARPNPVGQPIPIS